MPQLREALASQGLRLVDAVVQIQGGAAQHSGGQAGGWSGAGNFGPGTQTGGQQAGTGGQQHFGQAAESEPAAATPWNTSVEDESRVNVVV
jgi:flagellar hook-length control protein FliK